MRDDVILYTHKIQSRCDRIVEKNQTDMIISDLDQTSFCLRKELQSSVCFSALFPDSMLNEPRQRESRDSDERDPAFLACSLFLLPMYFFSFFERYILYKISSVSLIFLCITITQQPSFRERTKPPPPPHNIEGGGRDKKSFSIVVLYSIFPAYFSLRIQPQSRNKKKSRITGSYDYKRCRNDPLNP